MSYFIRISQQNSPANKLQTYILSLLEKYDHYSTTNPEAIFARCEVLVRQANRAFPRCMKQSAELNRDRTSQEISSIYVGALIKLSIHKIAGMLDDDVKPVPLPAPPAPQEPEPEPEPEPNDQPRQAVFISREHQRVHEFIEWTKFTAPVQSLLKKGAIWAAYYDGNRVVVEEYGGKTHPAY